MTTEFDNNSFEHDYILECLEHMLTDMKTAKSREQILDHYAVVLTAFMNGQIRQAVKSAAQNLSSRETIQETGVSGEQTNTEQ